MSDITRRLRGLHRDRHIMQQDRDGRARRDRDAVALDAALVRQWIGPDLGPDPDGPPLPAVPAAPPADADDHLPFSEAMVASLRRLGLATRAELAGAVQRGPDADSYLDAMLEPARRLRIRRAAEAVRAHRQSEHDKVAAERARGEAWQAVRDAQAKLRAAEHAVEVARERMRQRADQARFTADWQPAHAADRAELRPHVEQALAGTHRKWRLVDDVIVDPQGRPLLPKSRR